MEKAFFFRDRQAGVSSILIQKQRLTLITPHCLERELMKELFTVEFDFLDDALTTN